MQILMLCFLGLCAALSSGLNGIVIYVFSKMGISKLTFKDAFMMSMSCGDLLQSLFGYSLEIYSISERRAASDGKDQGTIFCKISGFIITFLALSSTAHLTALAYDRFLTICKPFIAERLHSSYFLCSLLISSCWVYALAWASFPFLGWSGYALEANSLRCSLDWASKRLKDQIYIVAIFVSCFILPVGVMVYSFYHVKRELRQMKALASENFGSKSKAAIDNVRAEKRHTKLAIVMSAVFIGTWLPYTLLSFWASFLSHVAEVPVTFANISAIIAKSSTMLNPIIYSIMHRNFRRSISQTPFGKLLLRIRKVEADETTVPGTTKA